MDIALKAVVTSPTGFYARQEHEWRGLSPEMGKWFVAKLGEADALAAKLSANKKGGPLSAALEVTIDGVHRNATFSGFTRKEYNKVQKLWHSFGDELVKIGEKQD